MVQVTSVPPPPPPPFLRIHSPPLSLPGLTLHSTLYSFYFLLHLHGHCPGRSGFAFCTEEEYFRIFRAARDFSSELSLKRNLSAGEEKLRVYSALLESLSPQRRSHIRPLQEASGERSWTWCSCSLDFSLTGRNCGVRSCSLVLNNTLPLL